MDLLGFLSEEHILSSALVGTLVALFGNNIFENARKRKDRKSELIRDAYLDGLRYLALSNNAILRMSSGNFEVNNIEATEKLYKVLFIASPDVIKSFTEVIEKISCVIFALSDKNLNLVKFRGVSEENKELINISLQRMQELNSLMKAYNEAKKTDRAEWDFIDNEFKEAQKNFSSCTKNKELADKNAALAHLELIRDGVNASMNLSPLIYGTILNMRRDIDRKLTKAQIKDIEVDFSSVLEVMKNETEIFLKRMDAEIQMLSKDDSVENTQ